MEIKTLRGLSLLDRLLIVDSDEELARAVEVIRRTSCSASACSDNLWPSQVDQEEARPSRSRR